MIANSTTMTPDSPFKAHVLLSDKLCGFLCVAKGTVLSRTEVTHRICQYAKENGLMEEDGQFIQTDPALRELLDYKKDSDLSLLRLQVYLKPHYTKFPHTTQN